MKMANKLWVNSGLYDWETTGWVFNKALDEVEVPINILYDIEYDEGKFPVICSTGSYIDDDGYEQDYLLSDDEVDRAYEHIYEAMQDDPRDEPDYYMEEA